MKRSGEPTEADNKKKVCFIPNPEVLDYIEGSEQIDLENDLDLDTLPARSRRLVDTYSDEEEEVLEEDEEEEERDVKEIAPPKIDSESSDGEEKGSSSESEEGDGVKITPFNLRDERLEGSFDADDNYIIYRDEDAYEDNWLQGISRDDIKLARQAELARQTKAAEAQNTPSDTMSLSSLLKRLAELLQPGETATQALQRLNRLLPPRRIGQRSKPSFTPSQLEQHEKIRQEIAQVTELTGKLASEHESGIDVYDRILKALPRKDYFMTHRVIQVNR